MAERSSSPKPASMSRLHSAPNLGKQVLGNGPPGRPMSPPPKTWQTKPSADRDRSKPAEPRGFLNRKSKQHSKQPAMAKSERADTAASPMRKGPAAAGGRANFSFWESKVDDNEPKSMRVQSTPPKPHSDGTTTIVPSRPNSVVNWTHLDDEIHAEDLRKKKEEEEQAAQQQQDEAADQDEEKPSNPFANGGDANGEKGDGGGGGGGGFDWDALDDEIGEQSSGEEESDNDDGDGGIGGMDWDALDDDIDEQEKKDQDQKDRLRNLIFSALDAEVEEEAARIVEEKGEDALKGVLGSMHAANLAKDETPTSMSGAEQAKAMDKLRRHTAMKGSDEGPGMPKIPGYIVSYVLNAFLKDNPKPQPPLRQGWLLRSSNRHRNKKNTFCWFVCTDVEIKMYKDFGADEPSKLFEIEKMKDVELIPQLGIQIIMHTDKDKPLYLFCPGSTEHAAWVHAINSAIRRMALEVEQRKLTSMATSTRNLVLRVSVPALQQSKIVQLPPTTDSDEARRVLLGKFRHNLDEEQKEGLQLFSVKYNTFLLSVIDNWAPINSVLKQHDLLEFRMKKTETGISV
eukprot:TRINITY_DN2787_c3_g1_i1.p1 TRINITY_DN2787_c3_g1~~TRINITY_DN2787_c3_g1_i1.p1  ORF type:complete len:570 (+),score=200.31 TRINITY_DN2787_c3_g1_i1:353-2062(+)